MIDIISTVYNKNDLINGVFIPTEPHKDKQTTEINIHQYSAIKENRITNLLLTKDDL